MRWMSSIVSAVVALSNGTPRMAIGGVAEYQRVGITSIIQPIETARRRAVNLRVESVGSAWLISVAGKQRVFKSNVECAGKAKRDGALVPAERCAVAFAAPREEKRC